MKKHEFPYQQGNLDWLCSIYATINLLHLKGLITTQGEAWPIMQKLVSDIGASGGDFSLAFTKGVYRNDVLSFLASLNLICQKINKPDVLTIEKSSRDGAIVFLKGGVDFSHYTVIQSAQEAGRFNLFDSYGFQQIVHRGGTWTLDGEAIQILNLYSVKKAT